MIVNDNMIAPIAQWVKGWSSDPAVPGLSPI